MRSWDYLLYYLLEALEFCFYGEVFDRCWVGFQVCEFRIEQSGFPVCWSYPSPIIFFSSIFVPRQLLWKLCKNSVCHECVGQFLDSVFCFTNLFFCLHASTVLLQCLRAFIYLFFQVKYWKQGVGVFPICTSFWEPLAFCRSFLFSNKAENRLVGTKSHEI